MWKCFFLTKYFYIINSRNIKMSQALWHWHVKNIRSKLRNTPDAKIKGGNANALKNIISAGDFQFHNLIIFFLLLFSVCLSVPLYSDHPSPSRSHLFNFPSYFSHDLSHFFSKEMYENILTTGTINFAAFIFLLFLLSIEPSQVNIKINLK